MNLYLYPLFQIYNRVHTTWNKYISSETWLANAHTALPINMALLWTCSSVNDSLSRCTLYWNLLRISASKSPNARSYTRAMLLRLCVCVCVYISFATFASVLYAANGHKYRCWLAKKRMLLRLLAMKNQTQLILPINIIIVRV